MAKKVEGYIKLQIPAGKATPAPPVGPALGQHGVNIVEFTKQFNARTADQGDLIIPVVITVYADRSFSFITKTPPAAVLLKKACGLKKEMEETIPGAAVRVTALDELPREDTYYRWLINATPAGMYPKVDDMPLDPAVLPRCENVFEAIYNPARTKLMRLAQQAGCHVIGGMAMLVWQAVQAHQYWYGAQFREEDIAVLIREMEQRMEGADE